MPASTTTTTAPAMVSPSVANGTTPPTSSLSTSGVKRRHDSDDDANEKPNPRARPTKKCRTNQVEYNVKFMAGMCYSAYATRQHQAGLTALSEDSAQAFKEKLVEIFQEIKSGTIVAHIGMAKETIPLLARKAPFEQMTNAKLTDNFINQYNCICGSLDLLDNLAVDIRVDEELLTYLYDTVSGIHHDLATAVMWHDVLRYTPLSLMGLRKLRDRIVGSREYRPINAVLGSIGDIEGWLSLPREQFEFSDDLKKVAMEAMREMSMEKAKDDRTARIAAEIPTYDQLLAKIKEEDAKKEQEKAGKEQEDARRLVEAQAEAKRQQEKADQEKKDAAQREAAARQKLQEEQRKQEVENARRKAEEAKKQKDAEDARTAEREKLRAEQEALEFQKVEAARLEELRLEQQQEEERRKLQAVEEDKKAERERVRAAGEQTKKSLLDLFSILQRGNAQEIQNLELPPKEQCITRLTELWSLKGNLIVDVLPHQLLADPDLLLELDHATMTNALASMFVLKVHGCEPNELFRTGWNLSHMVRLRDDLVPYTNGTPLSSLKLVVDPICDMLQEATDAVRNMINASFGSSTSTQQLSVFDAPLNTSVGSNTTVNTEQQSLPHTLDIEMSDVAKKSLVERMTKDDQPVSQSVQNNAFGHSSANNHQSAIGNDGASFQKTRKHIACKFAANGTCSRGDACDYTHPWDAVPDLPMDTPCHHFFRFGSCKYGDNCRLSHDPAHFGPPSTGRHLRHPRQPSPLDSSLEDRLAAGRNAANQDDWRSKIRCRDDPNCTKPNCGYNHSQPANPSDTTSRQNRGLGNSLLTPSRGQRNAPFGSRGGSSFGRNGNPGAPPRNQPSSIQRGALNRETEFPPQQPFEHRSRPERSNNNRRVGLPAMPQTSSADVEPRRQDLASRIHDNIRNAIRRNGY